MVAFMIVAGLTVITEGASIPIGGLKVPIRVKKVTDLTKEEIAEYVAGFRSNEAEEDWKDWGEDYDYGDDN